MKLTYAILAAAVVATPALAEGDAAKGEREFRKCIACHHIVDPAGEVIAGRAAVNTGPNLYGVIGRQAGTAEGFSGYSDAMVASGEAGLVWTEEELATYVADPTAYLRDHSGDSSARSNMTFKLPRGGEDVAAYLAQFGGEM
jgi:cytochrome c